MNTAPSERLEVHDGRPVNWTTPDDITEQVRRMWARGIFLASEVEGGAKFPLHLRLRRPDNRTMSERFDDVRRWIRALEDKSKLHRGFGYEVEWGEIDHRQLGRNRVPKAIRIPTRVDALRLVGRQRDAERFETLGSRTVEAYPELRGWIARRPHVLLEHAEVWPKVMAVIAWFRQHPRPGVYLRQIDIANVDTKFIESHKSLLMELLDLALPAEAVESTAGRQFDERYGLAMKRPLIRFRILDPRHRIGGLSEIATPAHELAALSLPVRRVFITENEINGLAFPEMSDAIVIFGLGYGLDRLGDVRWLHEKALFYWGDIDTHGFAILDRLRASFPEARSIMMDRETLDEHRASWVEELAPHTGPLGRLTAEEQRVFDDLVQNRLGDRVRLEQEHVKFGWVTRTLGELRARS